MAAVFERLADSLAPTVFGLLVAIPTLWGYVCLRRETEALDAEMRNATLELMNRLVRPPGAGDKFPL